MNIEFLGGFAWVFLRSGEVTAALVHKPGSPFNHKMVLEVPTSVVDQDLTTAKPVKTGGGIAQYDLAGDVTLAIDGTSLPPGAVSGDLRKTLYMISTINGRSEPLVDAAWRSRTSARLFLSGGGVSALKTNEQAATFVDGNGKTFPRRQLPTRALYAPPVVPKLTVDFTGAGGRITLKATPALAVKILAECNCGSFDPPEGSPLPGFEDVFELYPATLDKADHVVPLAATMLPSPPAVATARGVGGPGFITPGPDCPSTAHEL